jgi:hypothetical protein
MTDFQLANLDTLSAISDGSQSQSYQTQNFTKKNSISSNDPSISGMFKR